MLTIKLKDGTVVPRLGQGTWFIGDKAEKRKSEITTLHRGVELGMTLIDTAEMYGSGRSEQLIGEAIKPLDREQLFIVSKAYPQNCGRGRLKKACEASLKRLGTKYLHIYLLHWRGSIPLAETAECMQQLVSEGKIRRWGVSNLDTDDMQELFSVKDGDKCMVDQVLYHMGSRGIEYDLLPWLKAHNTPVMAYCPLAQGGSLRRGLLNSNAVTKIAQEKGVKPIQVLLAFVLHDENIIAIPRTSAVSHVEDNAAAAEIELDSADMDLIAQEFPSPTRKTFLDIV